MQSRAQQERDHEIRLVRRRQRERDKRGRETSEERDRRRALRNQRDRKRRRQRCLFVPEGETVVETQVPAVVQETGDSRAPPVRVFNNGKEYPLSACNNPPVNSHSRAPREPNQTFSDWNLPLACSSDTTVLSAAKLRRSLNAIASSSEPMALNLGEHLPNQVANPDMIGQEEEDKCLDYLCKELDPRVLDAVCCLLNLRHVDPQPLMKQFVGAKGEGGGGGGKGGRGRSISKGGQVQWGCGGGDDLFKYSPKPAGFVGFKEKPKNDTQRDASITMPATMVNNSMLPQFNQNCEELHLEKRNLEVDESTQTNHMINDRFPSEVHDPSLETEHRQQQRSGAGSQETQFDIGHASDFVCNEPFLPSNMPGLVVGITPVGKSIPHSQMFGNSTIAYPPLSSTSTAMSCPALHNPTSSMPPPSTFEPSDFLNPKSCIEKEYSVCEVCIPSHVSQESATSLYQRIVDCVEQRSVASGMAATMCSFEVHPVESRIDLIMPKDCKPLFQLLSPAVELKDRVLILQQVINTLATIHGHVEKLSLWGSFIVWVAPDMKVYLPLNLRLLFQKQQELACNGQQADVEEVQKIYQKLISPCLGQNESWVSPGLCTILHSFQCLISDASSSCRMAEAARTLGERRICRIDVDLFNLPIVIYCTERESLQSALEPLVPMVPRVISHIWEVRSIHPQGQSTMRAGDVATADRRMQLSLVPCMHPSDPRALYIKCNNMA